MTLQVVPFKILNLLSIFLDSLGVLGQQEWAYFPFSLIEANLPAVSILEPYAN
jgi:hypothetical protein